MGVFERYKLPFYQGYFTSGVIQYCKKTQHFRTLKFYGKERTDVLDEGTHTKLNTYDQRKKVLEDDPNWVNYIISFRAADSTR